MSEDCAGGVAAQCGRAHLGEAIPEDFPTTRIQSLKVSKVASGISLPFTKSGFLCFMRWLSPFTA
jgi:hypothetical protein